MADSRDQQLRSDNTPASGLQRSSTQFVGRHLWQYAVVQDVLWIGSIIGLLVIGYLLRKVLTPILIAFGLAYVLNPIVKCLEDRFRFPRLASVTGLIVLVIATLIITGLLLAPLLYAELAELAEHWPTYRDRLEDFVNSFDDRLKLQLEGLLDNTRMAPETLTGVLAGKAGAGFGFLGDVIGTAAYVVACCILVPIFYFFFAWRFDSYLQYGIRLVPSKYRERAKDLAAKMDVVVGNYIRGRVIASIFLCVGFSLGWWLAGVPSSLALGIVTGILGAAPWISTVGLPIAILLKYSDMVASVTAPVPWLDILLWPSLAFFGVQAMENYLVTPWIQSESMSMSPVMVITVLLIGGTAAGFYGLLLSLPIAGCGKVLWDEVVYPRWEQWANDT